MYSKLYIKYHCKREIEFERYPPRSDDVIIWLEFEFLNKIKFRRPGRYSGDGWRCIYTKEDLEDLKKEKYDYYDGLDNFDKNITLGIDIDPRDLLKNENMYIPVTLKEVTSKVFYSLEDVLHTCGNWMEDDMETSMIIEYKICRDPSTYNIELEKVCVIRRIVGRYKNLNKEMSFLRKEAIDGKQFFISEPGESLESLEARIKDAEAAAEEENKILEEIKREKMERAVKEIKKAEILNDLKGRSYDELVELLVKEKDKKRGWW